MRRFWPLAVLFALALVGWGVSQTSITRVFWSAIQGKPTTIAGYGITDVAAQQNGVLTTSSNLNTLTTGGQNYRLQGGNTYSNTPLGAGATTLAAGAHGALEVISSGGSNLFQRLALNDGTNLRYWRRDYNGSTWSSWASLIDSNVFSPSATIAKSGLMVTNCQQTGGFTPANDTLYLSPFYLSRTTTITNIQSRIVVAMGSGATYRVGLYDSDSNGLPASVLETSAATTGNTVQINTYTLSSARSLIAGLYWAGFVVTGATTFTNTVQGCTLQTTLMPVSSIGASRAGFSLSITSGAAFPANPSTSNTYGGNSPMIGYQMQ